MTAKSDYAPVNGLRLYYEIHGSPHPAYPPLVLLHGGGDTIATSFGRLLPALAATGRSSHSSSRASDIRPISRTVHSASSNPRTTPRRYSNI
jgi:pimeloyl-ACP methyl ester carboxylesterase